MTAATNTTMTTTTAPADPMAQYANPEATATSFLGPDYQLNPRYRAAIAADFASLDTDKDGYLTPADLAAEASSSPDQAALFRVKDLLRQVYQVTGTEYRDHDLAINFDAYINLMAITAQVEPESSWRDLRRDARAQRAWGPVAPDAEAHRLAV
ncbi:hypothetical protein AMAG_05858 [Allomyces macrogynus ATCC 38327]|uniref:EF-hand domain-containing protein n=1 Tax=Allomyces macrogynus (strain ATCC 38327) TaxID=578462 RepID=A0A0L0SDD2_ALLM3|nr:hypothetical protein AMAG_05858 [Allomyces macrogynus ATCC 38327]|eukprot:KNE60471.1 hypothetical protein AMAG_05858 [Allomyces macrogynus ATCC 38327]